MNRISIQLLIAITFLWIGFVGAISFMEAWIKFRAPGITLPLGLGRLVFSALNKMEWVCAVLIIFTLIFSKSKIATWNNIFILVPVIIILVQSYYLLPLLDARAEMYIKGLDVKPSNDHIIYVTAESVKLLCLIFFGILQFKK
jgi:hypothetical protein